MGNVQYYIDRFHRNRFRYHLDLVYDDAGWEKPNDEAQDRREFSGWMREFKKYIEWRGNSYGGDQLYANARRVFKGFFTPAGVYLLRFLNRVCPYFSRIMFQLTANLAMRWIVDCDIVYDKTDKTGKTQLVETCGFRKSLGESACIENCKIPTERFMKEEIGMNLTLNPGEGLSCKFCSGVSAVVEPTKLKTDATMPIGVKDIEDLQ